MNSQVMAMEDVELKAEDQAVDKGPTEGRRFGIHGMMGIVYLQLVNLVNC